jgi:hypothetical protein
MRRKVAECILMISLLSGCGMATGSSEALPSDVAASSSDESVVVSSTEEVQAGKTEQESSLVESGSEEDKQATIDTNSVEEQQQVPDSNGEGSSIVEGDGSAAEGSWDEDPVDTTGDDQQSGETQQPEEVQTGALTDYTQCAYYKTSKGKEHIERIINQVFGDLSTYSELPSQFILKPLNSAEMQQMFKDLIVKNDCKNGDEADNLKMQVMNTYVNTSGYLAYLQGGSSSSQQTPQQQQAVQQAQDSGLLQPIGGGDDSDSQGGDSGFTGEDPAAGGDDFWSGFGDCGIGGEAR